MLFKNKKTKDNISEELKLNYVNDKPEKENIKKTIREVINGKLYDTSKAINVCNLIIPYEKMPNYGFVVYCGCSESVSIYKGSTEWFIEIYGKLKPADEKWVKDILGKYDVEKYIEFFGEPELA